MDIKLFQRINRRLRLMLSRAVVNIINDAYKRQRIQIGLLAGEVADSVERFQNYGITSVPPVGSEAIVLSIGGKRQHLVAIAVEDKETRLKDLAAGDSAIYHMDGHYLLLTKQGGKTKAMLVCDEFEVKADKTVFDVQQTQFTGDVSILGSIEITGTSTASDHISGTVSGKAHIHLVPAISNAPTATPQ